jgi:L,D-transpeptidase-like protein
MRIRAEPGLSADRHGLPRARRARRSIVLPFLLLVLTMVIPVPWATHAGGGAPAAVPAPRAAARTAAAARAADAGPDALEFAPARETGPALVVHVGTCRFALYDAGGMRVLTGPCSTGSGETLRAPDGRTWTFATPRGARRVHHKAERPVWYKPDWAYLEAGERIPRRGDPRRYDFGVLGAYGIDIGGGYLVHGSPYRLDIGTRSTHGCIRLLDEHLDAVYHTLRVGDAVIVE